MEELSDILEQELENAVEVKDKNSLHRYVRLLVDNTVGKQRYESCIGELKSDVRLIAERIDQGFKRMDERFEAVDKRFESMQIQMDKRFESMDKRFESLQTQMDTRFESLQIQMNKRFDAVDKRFDEMNGKFRMLFTFMTIGFTIVTTVTVLIRLLA